MENRNEPAFPFKLERSDRPPSSSTTIYGGLTKREYFAAMAMQGYCANQAIASNGITLTEKAQSAVMMADELLKQLNS